MAHAMHIPQINQNGLTSFDYPQGLLYLFAHIEPSLYLVVTTVVPSSQLTQKSSGNNIEVSPRDDFCKIVRENVVNRLVDLVSYDRIIDKNFRP